MCGQASGWSILAFVALLVGVPVHIAGWATIHWWSFSNDELNREINVGLWRMEDCTRENCTDSSWSSDFKSDELQAARILETLTFCLSVLALILLIVFILARFDKRRRVAIAIMVLCFLAGACSFVGMIIIIISIPSPYEVDYSLGLSVVAMPFILIAGTLMIPDSGEPDYDEVDEDYYNTKRRSIVTPMTPREREPSLRRVAPNPYPGGSYGGRYRNY